MYHSLAYLSVPLPEDILKMKHYGDFKGASKQIDYLLNNVKLPDALAIRLAIEKDILNVLTSDEYPYDHEGACQLMSEKLKDFDEQELLDLREQGKVDWLFVNGIVHYQRRFLDTLVKTQPVYADRLYVQEDSQVDKDRRHQLQENVQLMKEKGERAARIHLKSTIKIKKEFERVGDKVKVHLPLPKNCLQISDIEIIRYEPQEATIADIDSEQRTICFETELEPDQVFSVEYAYTNKVSYVALDPEKVVTQNYACDVLPQAPHIQFTPYLQLLLQEIIGDETNPVKQARAIFDFITTRVNYSFMREYVAIDNISEYAAVNLKGDCGVQVLLFITLCRMAGIPAKWQSGLYVSEYYTGCHDWAQFYVAPYGWVFADLSFAGSAYRSGHLDRWNYYFGNLDIYRMVANSEIQSEFVPPKQFIRADPIDNQRGEVEYEDGGLLYSQLEVDQQLISMTEL